jgi:hypothetical protein
VKFRFTTSREGDSEYTLSDEEKPVALTSRQLTDGKQLIRWVIETERASSAALADAA